MAGRSVYCISKYVPLLLVFMYLFYSPGLSLICLKRRFAFISDYFVHLFFLSKIPYHFNQISGNQHPTQILSLEGFGGFFFPGSHYQSLWLCQYQSKKGVSKKPEAWHVSRSACLQFTQATPRQEV